MKILIDDKYLVALYQSEKPKGKFPKHVELMFIRRVNQIKFVRNENELRSIKSYHFEKLQGFDNRYSIRINDGWRIEFRFDEDGNVRILVIEKVSNHYK